MSQVQVTLEVRKASERVAVIDIRGDFTAAAEERLMDAYTKASAGGTQALVLNFSRLEYMNSSGIGLLVTLLIRVNRQKQLLLFCGLSAHYRHIFELTRLDDAIRIYDSEEEAVAAAQAL